MHSSCDHLSCKCRIWLCGGHWSLFDIHKHKFLL